MATRRRGSTRRKSPKRDDDDDLEIDVDEDDDFAWQSPKKSKKKSTGKSKSTRSKTGGSTRSKTGGSARSKAKTGGSARSSKAGSARSSASTSKKKATGKRKRPTGSSNENPKASSSLKRSGKRKKATSGRRSSAYDDEDDDDNGSGRRRRAPPPKKKGVDPIIPISIITGSLILCGGIFFIRTRKSNVVVRDEDKMLKEADELTKKGIAAFKAWNKIKRENGAVALEIQKHKEALDLLERAAVKMEEALAPYRNKDTGFLKKEYQGYEKMLQEIGQYRYDLQKSARTQ